MRNVLKDLQDYCLKVVSGILLYVGVTTVNSSCNAIFHQPEENKSLESFKNI